jgi:transposase-like protein
MKTNESLDRPATRFERFKEEAMQGLYDGKKMGGTDGVFAPMLKHLLESMLEGELNNHLEESKAAGENNRKNGKTKKTARSLQSGHLEIESSRDRQSTFEPKILPKRQLIITEELEDKAIAMHARGMRSFQKMDDVSIHNWGLTMSQLYIKFGERLQAEREFFLGG